MAYSYSSYVTALADVLVYTVTDANSASPTDSPEFNAIIPSIIAYAENRLYRELDLIQTTTAQTQTLTQNARSVTIPGNLIVLQGLNIITPNGAAPDDSNAQRNPVQRVSLDFLNFVCPIGTQTDGSPGIPKYYTNLDNSTVLLGYAPNRTYTAEFIGTVRPAPLSAANPNTVLATYLPDLFLAASLVFGFGFERDFGAQASDPQAAMSWETQYRALLPSAVAEVQRMKAQGQSWMPFSDAPKATMQRGPQ